MTGTWPFRSVAVRGSEVSHPVAPANDGMLPSFESWRLPSVTMSVLRVGDRRPQRPAWRRDPAACGLAKRPEGRPDPLAEELRLLPRGEVSAAVHLVPVDEVAECLLGPA